MASDTYTDLFSASRPRLLGIAYGMLGEFAEAEDVVQDAWLRLFVGVRRKRQYVPDIEYSSIRVNGDPGIRSAARLRCERT